MAFVDTAHTWRNASTGYWYLVWREGGSSKRKSLRTKSKAEASRRLALALQQAPQGWVGATKMSVADAASAWLEDKRRPERALQTSTLRQYAQFVDLLQRAAPGWLLVDEIGPQDVQRLLDRMADIAPCSQSTLRKRFGVATMLFEWLTKQEVIRRNPVKPLEPPKAQAQPKPDFSEEEVEQLLAALEEDFAGAQSERQSRARQGLFDLVTVLALSGMRRREAFRLEWADIELEKRLWLLRSPRNKGGERHHPIHDSLLGLLRRRQLLGEAGPFSASASLESAWRSFKRRHEAWERADLHSLRHGFVTRVRRRFGADAARYLVGHRSPAMTDHYTHFGPEEFRDALNQL